MLLIVNDIERGSTNLQVQDLLPDLPEHHRPQGSRGSCHWSPFQAGWRMLWLFQMSQQHVVFGVDNAFGMQVVWQTWNWLNSATSPARGRFISVRCCRCQSGVDYRRIFNLCDTEHGKTRLLVSIPRLSLALNLPFETRGIISMGHRSSTVVLLQHTAASHRAQGLG